MADTSTGMPDNSSLTKDPLLVVIAGPTGSGKTALSLAVALPFYVAFLWAPTWQLALIFLTGAFMLNYFYLASSVALVHEEVRPDQRVMSGALLLLVMNFIGLGFGPTWVGAASDWFAAHGTPHALQAALYTLTPFYVIAILLFLWLARTLRREERPA